MGTKKFATVINCIDGRAHPPVTDWLQTNFDHLDFLDRITDAGVDGVLAFGSAEKLAHIRKQVLISVNAHKSRLVAVVGHDACAGNPVSPTQHIRHIRRAVEIVKSWQLPVRVVGLWLNEQWQVELIVDSGEPVSPDGHSQAAYGYLE